MQLTLMYGGRSVEHDWSIAIYNHFIEVLNSTAGADVFPRSIYYVSRHGGLLRLELDGKPAPKHNEFEARAETHPLASLPGLLKRDGLFVFSLLQGQDGVD